MGPSVVGLSRSRRAGTIDFSSALAALVSPVQNIIFHTAHFLTFVSAHRAQQPGQAVMLGHLSLFSVLCLDQSHMTQSSLNIS